MTSNVWSNQEGLHLFSDNRRIVIEVWVGGSENPVRHGSPCSSKLTLNLGHYNFTFVHACMLCASCLLIYMRASTTVIIFVHAACNS